MMTLEAFATAGALAEAIAFSRGVRSRLGGETLVGFIKRFVIEAVGRQLWLAMNPRSGPSAHAEGYT